MNASSGNVKSVPVSSFVEAGSESLGMSLIAGKAGLNRRIVEATINRPGLAFVGFFRYFAHRRIQVLGLAEYAYLSSVSDEERGERLKEFYGRKIPCVVIARNKKAFPQMVDLAERLRIPLLKTRLITKHFVNAATIIMENLTAPRATAQGTMVEIMGIGVLIEGKAGMGKSEIALGLIRKGHALVSDDITAIRLDSTGSVIGAPVNVTRYHMEIRGLGIIHVPSLFGVASVRGEKKLDLVVTLCEPGTMEEAARSGEIRSTWELLGAQIPRVYIPVAPGRDLANILETAALDQKLRALGHDAEKELDERLMALMSGGRDASE